MKKKSEPIDDYLLGKWLSGELTPDEQNHFDLWATETNENKKYLNDSKKIISDIEALRVMHSVDSQKAIKKVKRKITNVKNPLQHIFHYWQRIAAIIVLPLLVYSVYEGINHISGQGADIVWNEISTPVGMRSEFILPDGSKVWLNSNTTLRYPMQFAGNERYVELSGEAFFDVLSDKKNPFVVDAGQMLVQAVGTSFNVSAYPNDGKIETALIDGKVNILTSDGKDRRTLLSLQPGQLGVFHNVSGEGQIISRNLDKHIAWREGKILFRNDALDAVLQKLGHWYNVDFDVSGKVNMEYVFTGTFHGESLHQILEYIELTTPIEFVFSQPAQSDDNTYVKRKVKVSAN